MPVLKASLRDLLVMLLGFAAGAVVGYLVALLQGFDPFNPVPGSSALPGLVLTALGGLVGLRLARRWHVRRQSGKGR